MKPLPEVKNNSGTWVQTERAAHEAFVNLITRSPLAAKIMHTLVSRVGEHNAVVISQATLAELTGSTRQGVSKALKILVADRWIEIRRIGATGQTNAYIVNDRVAWLGKRDGIRYSLFSASVVLSSREQPDEDAIDDPHRPNLRKLPRIGEQQLPSGDGLPPPSEPALPGLEPDLPATGQTDLEDFTNGK